MKRLPMSVNEYHMLPEHPGMRVEYYDECAVITARNQPVTVSIPVERREIDIELTVQPVDLEDNDALATAFRSAFYGTADFYEVSETDLQNQAGGWSPVGSRRRQ